MAERVGFEPTVGYEPTAVFKTAAINRSAISPCVAILNPFPEARVQLPILKSTGTRISVSTAVPLAILGA